MSLTWRDLAVAAGAPPSDPDEQDYLLWNASSFPFSRPRQVFRELRHALRHKVCIDPARLDPEGEWEAAHADEIVLPPLVIRRGDPTNCWPDVRSDDR